MKAHLQAYKGDYDSMADTLMKGGLAAVAGKIFSSLKMFKKAKTFYQDKKTEGISGSKFSYIAPKVEPNS